MVILQWTGRAVSVNKWHVVRGGRISPSREYEKFIDALAWSFRSQCRDRFERIDIEIVVELRSRRSDKQNYLKPICDALVRAGIVEDDNAQIGRIVLSPPLGWGRPPEEDSIKIYVEGYGRRTE